MLICVGVALGIMDKFSAADLRQGYVNTVVKDMLRELEVLEAQSKSCKCTGYAHTMFRLGNDMGVIHSTIADMAQSGNTGKAYKELAKAEGELLSKIVDINKKYQRKDCCKEL